VSAVLQLCRRSNPLAFAAWAALIGVIAWASLSPQLHPPSDGGMDKLLHAAAYAVIAGAPFMVFGTWRLAAVAAMSVPVLGVLLEIGQMYVPGRSGDLFDAAADCIGAFAGSLIASALRAGGATGPE
jgi:VanZ family protein